MVVCQCPCQRREVLWVTSFFLFAFAVDGGFILLQPSSRRHPVASREKRPRDDGGSSNSDGDGGGYQFGDLTRGFLRRMEQQSQKSSGNDGERKSSTSNSASDDGYQFGDVARWLDGRAKDRVNAWTGKSNYEFGDLTRWADRVARDKIANYTGKGDYQVGDISKEILRRTWAGEYQLDDVWLVLKVIISQGLGITAFARLLPVKVLLELINVGLAQEVGGKLVGVLATTVDERLKEAFTGNPKYQVGDATKDQITRGLAKFTGKDQYEFGDISKRITSLQAQATTSTKPQKISLLEDEPSAADVLAAWDKKFQERK